MSKKNTIDKLLGAGLQFHSIENVIEIFPFPIPSEINDVQIEDESELFRMSAHEGFEELYVPSNEIISAESEGKTHKITREEFLRWQLERMSSKTIYQLISKTSANLTEILDSDAEYDKDNSYDPESWLNPYDTEDGNYEKGLKFIERLKNESPDEFYKILIDSIIDPDFGVLEHLETEIDGNLDEVRALYENWDVPLMIVSTGKFNPYIEADSNLMMDDYKLQHMYVRNQDEGEI